MLMVIDNHFMFVCNLAFPGRTDLQFGAFGNYFCLYVFSIKGRQHDRFSQRHDQWYLFYSERDKISFVILPGNSHCRNCVDEIWII